jgi:TRAP-type C4-dicarboxylate transport system permease small subunit
MQLLRRMDEMWASFEKALTVFVLISMVLVAGVTAGIRNIARLDIRWAAELLMDLDFADSYLRKATLWLAFLGASLACYYGKHINIDVVTRYAPLPAKYTMRALAGMIGGLVAVALAYSFASAVYLNLTERPLEYEVMDMNGNSMHVCDASARTLKDLQIKSAPTSFCASRKVLSLIGIPAETPGAAFQIIVPIMFFIMGLRLFATGVGHFRTLTGGRAAIEAAEAEDLRQQIEEAHAADGADQMRASELKYAEKPQADK